MTLLKWIGLTLILLSIGVFLFSPLQNYNGKQQVRVSIEIEKSVNIVFAYMGNSNNASIWSTYVDHISPLNAEEFPDGAEGSLRRCYQESDESGIRWDERILKVVEHEIRTLSIYNTRNFPIMIEGLETTQEFRASSDEATVLSLSLYLNRTLRFWEHLKFRLAAWKIKSVFRGNLVNIKNQLEDHG